MTLETTADIDLMLDFVKARPERLFRLSDDVRNAVSAAEMIELYEDLKRAIRDKMILGQEPSVLEKFTIRLLIDNGICVW